MTLLQSKIGMPLDEFMEAAASQPFDLINDKRIQILPTVFGHSLVIRDFFFTAQQIYGFKRE